MAAAAATPGLGSDSERAGEPGLRSRAVGGGGGPKEEEREPSCPRQELTKHSYWFDLWLFLLFDLVLFVFVYLLP
ncbi:sarcoplasmic/endoplasmic reticulum calcium ATPase regulator ARLN [Sminthopsis crassicaudata]|uniref:sarcoplasmic/endoplasmic reticulum calcium ATPase regulator ARLN n=1 Tax=Sminthopsis crassicaudata TaxID=9301 RepID=UPI003D68E3B2